MGQGKEWGHHLPVTALALSAHRPFGRGLDKLKKKEIRNSEPDGVSAPISLICFAKIQISTIHSTIHPGNGTWL